MRLSILFVTFLSQQIFAQAVQCEINGAARCNCSHSLFVTCGDNRGHIADTAKPSSITVVTTDSNGIKKTTKLENPPDGIRDYYAVQYNQWVANQLKSKGIEYKSVGVSAFEMAKMPVLYEDADGKEAINPQDEPAPAKLEGLVCATVGNPLLVNSTRC